MRTAALIFSVICIIWAVGCKYFLIFGGADPVQIDGLIIEAEKSKLNPIKKSNRFAIGWLGLVVFLVALLN